jgi:hypothetical protein
MTRQIVGIGSSANDGTGDTLREAMDKLNDNTLELYGDDLILADFVDSDYRDGAIRNADLTAWLTSLSGSFTRGGSDHRYINSSGNLVNGSADTLRIQYDPVTLKAIGALIEPSRQNLLRFSDTFTNSVGVL